MLAQNHAASAHHAGNDEDETEPPDGVEVQVFGKGKQRACHTTDGRCVRGNLPPDVDECTDNLYQQACHDDGSHEVGHVHA